jgi:hypothetical protein
MSVIWIDSGRLAVAAGGYDTDAQNYITAVETADGQSLETAVKDAINAFVVGCKSDGIWSAIKASCILAGARTLAGALVPLVGPAPTNNGFTSGDYNRKTGLKGNGSSKYLVANRLLNADPQNDIHLSVFKNDAISAANPYYIGGYNAAATVVSVVGQAGLFLNSTLADSTINSSAGLHGASRSSSSSVLIKRPGAAVATFSSASTGTLAFSPFVFTLSVDGSPGTQFSASSLTWYSQGLSLNLTSLDGRISTLMSALAAAIP